MSKRIILFYIFSYLLSYSRSQLYPTCDVGLNPVSPVVYAKDVYLSDFNIFLSIGDTVLSGFAANDASNASVNEYRGLSFVTGNSTNAWTIRNIFTTGTGAAIYGGSANLLNGIRGTNVYYPTYDGLNGASKGNEQSLDSQMSFVINQGSAYFGGSTFNNTKWKMVNVYIGLFKACSICSGIEAAYQTMPGFWQSYYYDLITSLTAAFPNKAIINMIGLPQLSQFYSSTPSNCKTYNQANNICPCLWSQSSTTLKSVIDAANQGLKNAIQYWRSDVDQTTTTVGVVYQPFMTNTTYTSGTLSAVDCFHPSATGHKLMTIGLWNNIRQKASGDKATSVTTSTDLICEDTFDGVYDPNGLY
ncbi:hypothetical protein PPL_05872 [Heterostelium album PN500]|uniref:Uncharacterized protein n=1 Tax=Heterostelium pallidum (strain ATCC 26659 / Pp 5 / PN500) TaxID=670386 RepID=D3BBK4_HETP5|nr:hypothetical protein PPL_05872 [Heterostelium album PN500]EFA81037.1 hypothetical protein PPL_05872 [Heterostelium album PN500]|eukprot:XP_020433155.1 hypothetical protein PPL_05872 [Heterostelium album PN500]